MAIPAPAVAARRAAALFVERRRLEPPVDVEALLRERAELTRVDWPMEDVDAVLTGLAGDPKGVSIFIRATSNLARERFTMAHELGHLLLPWHLPDANCEIGDGDVDLPRTNLEHEADVFASCLLLPDSWLKDLVHDCGDDMSQLIREMNAAQVSTGAVLHALRRFLLAGWVFVAYGGNQVVATRGTNVPDVGSRPPATALRRHATSHGEALLNGYSVQWFRMFEPSAIPQKLDTDSRTDHDVLMDAIAMVEPDEARWRSIAQSANGKVGGGLREAGGRPAAETYEAMRHRCENWEHVALLEQPDFILWLAQRARAIETGATKRRKKR